MLEKIKGFYDSGALIAELFEKSYVNVLLSRKCVALRNRLGRISADPKIKNYIILEKEDFASVSNAIGKWREINNTLWGRIASGSSMVGYRGATYYPPNSETGIYIKKGESAEHLKIGKTEEVLRIKDLEFVIERFYLTARRRNQMAHFDLRWQESLIAEAFVSYDALKRNYKKCDYGLIEEAIKSYSYY